jgi:predicted amidohydrolase
LVHGGSSELLVLADIDPSEVAEIRASMPFLKDRQPQLFEKLAGVTGSPRAS